MLAKNSVFRFALTTAMLLGAGVVFGDVFDDALIWWRGAYDENGDGAFSAAEFYNHKYAKTDAAHQTDLASVSGDSTISIVNDDVVSVWCGQTNNMPVLRFNQDAVDSPSTLTLKPSNVGISEPVRALTIHFRFKWDGDFGALTKPLAGVLFSTVNYWHCRGIAFQIANGKCVLKVGRKSYDCTHFGLQAGNWYDLFFFTSDNAYQSSTADRNCSMRIDIVKATGSTTTQWPGASDRHPGSTWLYPTRANQDNVCTSTAFDPADSIAIGENFKGEIAQFGFWPRQLTDDEIRQVSVSPVMGPALLTVGKADGKSDEFAKSPSTATNSVTLPGSWDGIPAQLDANNPKMSVRFYESRTGVNDSKYGSAQISYTTTFDHVLVMKAAENCGNSAVQVFIDRGTANEKDMGKRFFTARSAEYFWVPALAGNAWHTLDVECVHGTFELDYAKIYGSWCLGNRVYSHYKDSENQYKGNTKLYPLEWNIPCLKLTGGALEAATDPFNEAAACTLVFDLDEEFAKLGYKYTAATGQSGGGVKTHSIVYVNGVEFGKYTTAYQYGDLSESGWISFPPNTFHAGRNTLAIRYDPDYHQSGFWVSARGHIMLPQQDTLPAPTPYQENTVILVR